MSGTVLKKWEVHEDVFLSILMKEGKTYQEIANKFKTSVYNIKERVIEKLILPEYSENVKELAEKYNFEDSEYLKRCLECKKKKKEDKQKKKSFTDEKYYEILQNIIERLDRIEKQKYI
jgi:hypothetical protein